MKYIYNREQFLKEAKFYDSDKDNVRFQDTFIGSLLNRALGKYRNVKNVSSVSEYMDQLDSLLADIFINKFVDDDEQKQSDKNSGTSESDGKKVDKSKFLEEGKKILAIEKAQKSLELIEKSKFEEVYENLPKKEQIKLLPEEVENKFTELFPYYYSSQEVTKIIRIGLMVIYKNEKLAEIKNIKGNKVDISLVLEDDKLETDVNLFEISPIIFTDEYFKNIDRLITKINSYIKIAEENGCDDSLTKNAKSLRDDIEKLLNELSKNPTRSIYDKTFKKLVKIKDELNKCQGVELSYSDETILTENNQPLKKTISFPFLGEKLPLTITGKNLKGIEKLKAKLKKERREIDDEDIEKLNKKVKRAEPQDGLEDIKGDVITQIVDIVVGAKNSLVNQKPYDELLDKQKRNFDKLDGGRAINKKGYDKFNKRLLEISSYYKDLIPVPLKRFLTSAAKKTNIDDDYVTISQDLLGLDVSDRNRKSYSPSSSRGISQGNKENKSQIRVGTEDDSIGFVPINSIFTNNSFQKIAFAFKNEKDGGKWWSCVVISSRKASEILNFKYVVGDTINTRWMTNYFPNQKIGKNILDIPKKSDTDSLYDTNFTSKGDLVESFNIKEINYAQCNTNEFKKGKSYDLKVVKDITDLDSEVKDIRVEVDSILLLVGSKDFRVAETKVIEKEIEKEGKDRYIERKTLEDIANKSF